jgi:hypothetical protein
MLRNPNTPTPLEPQQDPRWRLFGTVVTILALLIIVVVAGLMIGSLF